MLTSNQIRAVMEQALGPVGEVTSMRGATLLEVSRPQAEKATQMGCLRVGGETVTLEVVRKRLTPSDIFEYLQEELRTREESQVLMGGLDRTKPRQAQAVSSTSKEDNTPKEGSVEAPVKKFPFESRPKGNREKGGKNEGKSEGKSGKGKGGKQSKGKGKGKGKGWQGKGGRGPPSQDQQ